MGADRKQVAEASITRVAEVGGTVGKLWRAFRRAGGVIGPNRCRRREEAGRCEPCNVQTREAFGMVASESASWGGPGASGQPGGPL